MQISLSLQPLHKTTQAAIDRLSRRDRKEIAELLWLSMAFVVLAFGLAIATGGYHGGFETLHRLSQAAWPDEIWKLITWFGDGRVLIVFSLPFVRRRPEIFWALIVGVVIAGLYTRGAKILFDVPRPPAVLPPDEIRVVGRVLKHGSFPSGHTLSAFLFAGVLFAFGNRWRARLPLLAAATLVGISRVALGVHWPQDIIAGAFSGLLLAAAAVALTRKWRVGLQPTVHLVIVATMLIAMLTLLYDNQSNPPMPTLVYPLVVIGVTSIAVQYRDLVSISR
ncbi:MAG: phosphatase PAP2 family protein [Chromatiaceae bacterium]|nr:phosphatase PAP2 family protein [Chromatiaceae bacterium]